MKIAGGEDERGAGAARMDEARRGVGSGMQSAASMSISSVLRRSGSSFSATGILGSGTHGVTTLEEADRLEALGDDEADARETTL